MMTDNRLTTINQMILAVIFGLGLLMVIFALLFLHASPTAQTLTIVGTLITQLGTVVIMQNTHFFKTPDPSPTGAPTNATTINAQTVNHSITPGSSLPPVV